MCSDQFDITTLSSGCLSALGHIVIIVQMSSCIYITCFVDFCQSFEIYANIIVFMIFKIQKCTKSFHIYYHIRYIYKKFHGEFDRILSCHRKAVWISYDRTWNAYLTPTLVS